MKMLVLEDREDRIKVFKEALNKHEVDYTDSAKEAIELLKKKRYTTLFLDHDLDGQEMVPSGPGTGYEVAEFLSEHKEFMPTQVIIHSLNNVGGANMVRALPNAILYPGIWLKLKDMV